MVVKLIFSPQIFHAPGKSREDDIYAFDLV